MNCPKCDNTLKKQPGEMFPIDYTCPKCNTDYQLKDGQLLAIGGIVPQPVIGLDGFDRPNTIGSTKNIREYNAKRKVAITKHENGRWVIVAYNEGGYNSTRVDLQDVIDWVKDNLPELLSDNNPKIDPSGHPVDVIKQMCENNNIELSPEAEKQLRNICDEPMEPGGFVPERKICFGNYGPKSAKN